MPIIIDEIVISVEVTAPAAGAAEARPNADLQETIVQQCVDRVLAILRERAER